MPTLTVQHVFYQPPQDDTREIRPINSSGGFILLKETKSTLEANHPFQFDSALVQQTLIIGSHTYHFSFVNVAGLAGGPLTWIDHTVAPKPATVGTANVMARIIYQPLVVPDTYGVGAFIDSFDVSTGNLVNNDFVTVNPDDQDESVQANSNGFVPGAEQINKYPPPDGYNIINVTAYPHITLDPDLPNTVNASFVEWINLNTTVRTIEPRGNTFRSPTNRTDIMLALYKSVFFTG